MPDDKGQFRDAGGSSSPSHDSTDNGNRDMVAKMPQGQNDEKPTSVPVWQERDDPVGAVRYVTLSKAKRDLGERTLETTMLDRDLKLADMDGKNGALHPMIIMPIWDRHPRRLDRNMHNLIHHKTIVICKDLELAQQNCMPNKGLYLEASTIEGG
uniref:Uncharacterized protein n=1 Tax=Cannabis sativa TaxID=3483 RepID=A0A803QGG2_CANSA